MRRPNRVTNEPLRVGDVDLGPSFGIGHAARGVRAAEGAVALARADGLPGTRGFQREAEIAAVAASLDPHRIAPVRPGRPESGWPAGRVWPSAPPLPSCASTVRHVRCGVFGAVRWRPDGRVGRARGCDGGRSTPKRTRRPRIGPSCKGKMLLEPNPNRGRTPSPWGREQLALRTTAGGARYNRGSAVPAPGSEAGAGDVWTRGRRASCRNS